MILLPGNFKTAANYEKFLSVSFSCDKQFMTFGVDLSHLIAYMVKESSYSESWLLVTESATEHF